MPKFSLIYPTRNRPLFIEKALWFLQKQRYADFEIVVSDNYTDAKQSCEAICKAAGIQNLRYVRPPTPMNMVEHWNFALRFATGDYICYFTDKTFLLPDSLVRAAACIDGTGPDILNWTADDYVCHQYPHYFAEGVHHRTRSAVPRQHAFAIFDPKAELAIKAKAEVPRQAQEASTYVRGKICFGGFRASLCEEIVKRTGALFHPTSPDYTSMILGLSLARSGAELCSAGVVQVSTDLSTGGQAAIHDGRTREYLSQLGNAEELLSGVLIPGLYCSAHNMISYDYLSLRRKFELGADLDEANWLVHIGNDLDDPSRVWSSAQLKSDQIALLRKAVADLPPDVRQRYEQKRLERKRSEAQRQRAQRSRAIVRSLLPAPVADVARRFMRRSRPLPSINPCRTIEDVIDLAPPITSSVQ